MENIIKLTFTGDVMCEAIQIKSHKTNNEYNFDEPFNKISSYFNESDYVVINLETPIAGEELGYCDKLYHFNSPKEFAKALKDMGVNLVTTANNHCLDRGVEGLKNTIKNLDELNIKHIGTNYGKKSTFIDDINGFKIGFLSYTYGTNAFANNNYLKKKEKYMVNLLQEQELSNPVEKFLIRKRSSFIGKVYTKLCLYFIPDQINGPVYERREFNRRCMKELRKEIKDLKKQNVDYIIMCMHMGGQYNTQPTKRTQKLADKITEYGVDAIIGNHEHVVHKSDFGRQQEGIVKTYSLGNFFGLAGTIKEPYDKMAEYSILLNLYLNKRDTKVNIKKSTFSITKTILIDEGKVETVLLYDLINKCMDNEEKVELINDNLVIYNKFMNTNLEYVDLVKEYEI